MEVGRWPLMIWAGLVWCPVGLLIGLKLDTRLARAGWSGRDLAGMTPHVPLASLHQTCSQGRSRVLRKEKERCMYFFQGSVWVKLCYFPLVEACHMGKPCITVEGCYQRCGCRLLLLFNHQVMSDSLWPHGLLPARLPCPWAFPGKHTGVGCHLFLQGVFPTQGSNPFCLAGRFFTSEPPGEHDMGIGKWHYSNSQVPFEKLTTYCLHNRDPPTTHAKDLHQGFIPT